MDFLRKLLSGIVLNLDVPQKTLTISYGDGHISVHLCNDGKVNVSTELSIQSQGAEAISGNIE